MIIGILIEFLVIWGESSVVANRMMGVSDWTRSLRPRRLVSLAIKLSQNFYAVSRDRLEGCKLTSIHQTSFHWTSIQLMTFILSVLDLGLNDIKKRSRNFVGFLFRICKISVTYSKSGLKMDGVI